MQKTTVLLADDNLLLRNGLRALLEQELDIDVIGEAKNGQQAVRMAKRLHPEVVIMDIEMPSMNSWEATRRIHQQSPECRVLILSSYGKEQYVRQVCDTGACGYVIKETASVDLVMAIREAKRGNTYFSPGICRSLLDRNRGLNDRLPADLKTGKLPGAGAAWCN